MEPRASRRTFLTEASLLACTLLLPARAEAGEVRHEYCLFIDLNRCIGCHSCAIACRAQMSQSVWRLRVGSHEDGRRILFTPVLCRHCTDPVCVKACPVGALRQDGNGIVSVDEKTCTGCGTCTTVCPYQGIVLGEDHRAHKCDLCSGRPLCVESCSSHALVFGDLADPAFRAGLTEEQKKRVAEDPLRVHIIPLRSL